MKLQQKKSKVIGPVCGTAATTNASSQLRGQMIADRLIINGAVEPEAASATQAVPRRLP